VAAAAVTAAWFPPLSCVVSPVALLSECLCCYVNSSPFPFRISSCGQLNGSAAQHRQQQQEQQADRRQTQNGQRAGEGGSMHTRAARCSWKGGAPGGGGKAGGEGRKPTLMLSFDCI
jgi:hypothetical protein